VLGAFLEKRSYKKKDMESAFVTGGREFVLKPAIQACEGDRRGRAPVNSGAAEAGLVDGRQPLRLINHRILRYI